MNGYAEEREGGALPRYRDPSGRLHSLALVPWNPRRSRAAVLREAAEIAREESKRVRRDRVDPKLGSTPIDDYAAFYFETALATGQLSQRTHERDEGLWRNHIAPRFGGWPVDQIMAEDIQPWVNALRKKLSADVTNKSLALLGRILSLAVDERAISTLPTARTKRAKMVKAKARTPRPGEVQSVISVIDGHYRPFMKLLATSGLRIGEAAALRPEDFDLDKLRLDVNGTLVRETGKGTVRQPHPKTSAGFRTVPIASDVLAELVPLIESTPAVDAYVFVTQRGAPIALENFRRRHFYPAIAEAGVPRFTPNQLRHFAISMWGMSGVPVKKAQLWAGHEDSRMTLDVYSSVLDDTHGEDLAGLVGLFDTRPDLRVVSSD